MEKPISLILRDTKLELAKICNDSQLPVYLLEPILKELYIEVNELTIRQIQEDEKMYKESIQEDNKNNE